MFAPSPSTAPATSSIVMASTNQGNVGADALNQTGRSAGNDIWLPLFPLNAVLFPDGIMPLRIFEARYIDMVRDCMRRDTPFGVVLLKSGSESGQGAKPENVGCIAHIISWDMPQFGLLQLRTRGGLRFRIHAIRHDANDRLEGRIDLIAVDAPAPITEMHLECARTLKLIIDDLYRKHASGQEQVSDSPFALPIRLDDSAWVADRWCEILPIPLKAKQKLLELEDAESRLEIVYQFLQQHKVL